MTTAGAPGPGNMKVVDVWSNPTLAPSTADTIHLGRFRDLGKVTSPLWPCVSSALKERVGPVDLLGPFQPKDEDRAWHRASAPETLTERMNSLLGYPPFSLG